MVPTLYMKARELRKPIVAKAHASIMKAPALDAKARELKKTDRRQGACLYTKAYTLKRKAHEPKNPIVAKAHASIMNAPALDAKARELEKPFVALAHASKTRTHFQNIPATMTHKLS